MNGPDDFLTTVYLGLVQLRWQRYHLRNGLREPPWLRTAIEDLETVLRVDLSGPERPTVAGTAAPPDSAGGDAMLTTKETAEMLKLSSRTVRRAVQDGRLPVHRFGRSVRFRRADIETFIDQATRR